MASLNWLNVEVFRGNQDNLDQLLCYVYLNRMAFDLVDTVKWMETHQFLNEDMLTRILKKHTNFTRLLHVFPRKYITIDHVMLTSGSSSLPHLRELGDILDTKTVSEIIWRKRTIRGLTDYPPEHINHEVVVDVCAEICKISHVRAREVLTSLSYDKINTRMERHYRDKRSSHCDCILDNPLEYLLDPKYIHPCLEYE